MDIRGLEDIPPSIQADPRQRRVMKKGEEFPPLKPETFTLQELHDVKNEGETTSPVTAEEKAFFSALFPDASKEIASHVTYSPRGLQEPIQTGRMVDRKG